MEQALYVSLSAQMALERRLQSVAANVANARSAGYRADGVRFSTVVDRIARQEAVDYASAGESFISRETGPMTETGNPMDVAVQGGAWFSVMTAAGPAYTRDGRMTMDPAGRLKTVTGQPVLDAGGAEIVLDPNGGPPDIARDGMISQDGRQLGAIGLFAIPEDAGLTRVEDVALIPDRPAEPVLDFTADGVLQGYVEQSNVDAVGELVRLIAIQRSFESASGTFERTEKALNEAIRTLGNR